MTLNAGDEFTFDVKATRSGSTVTVGCQSAPLNEVAAAAESVNITGSSVDVVGLKGKADRDPWGNVVVTVTGLSGVAVSARDLEARATNIDKVASAATWQDGDVILLSGTVSGKERVVWRVLGSWYTSEHFVRRGGDVGTRGRWSDGDAWITDRFYADRVVPIVRGGKVVADKDKDRPFRAGDRVRLIRDIGANGTVGEVGTLERRDGDTGGLAIRLDHGVGGVHGYGLYTLGLSARSGGRTIEQTVEHID